MSAYETRHREATPTEEQVTDLGNALMEVFDFRSVSTAQRKARAVLALLPQRCAPSPEVLRDALEEAYSAWNDAVDAPLSPLGGRPWLIW